jgi:hypothetical protein
MIYFKTALGGAQIGMISTTSTTLTRSEILLRSIYRSSSDRYLYYHYAYGIYHNYTSTSMRGNTSVVRFITKVIHQYDGIY